MIEIKMNPNDDAKVKAMLAGIKGAPETVMSRSINKTLTGVRTDASAEIRNIINAKKSVIDATFRIVKATVTKLSALFESKGKPLPLIDFSARQVKAGVSVQVKKASGRSVIAGAFIRTLKGGHKGVFWREWHDKTKTRQAQKQKIAYAKLPRSYRLPIKERFGPRVPDILGDQPVISVVLKKAEERLHTNIEHELNYELSKL